MAIETCPPGVMQHLRRHLALNGIRSMALSFDQQALDDLISIESIRSFGVRVIAPGTDEPINQRFSDPHMVRPGSWTRPAGESPARVIAREPGSRPRQEGETPLAERGVESLRGGSKSAGRSGSESYSLVRSTKREPSRSCHGEGQVRQVLIGNSDLPGPSGVQGSARVQGLVGNRRDPSAQPRQQRPLV
jgi:hypothetical protein